MLIDINGDGLPDRVFDRNPKTDRKGFLSILIQAMALIMVSNGKAI
ncbi:hypothetical protein BSPWISOXPB_8844 [uncultured Gammaproteobacteria bacterium]|nr:hypothetical protein BSPWISOXPB_8844 [uncultured Gammaproteobacteria bacterium]